jgi:hypothetical protein
MKVYLGSTKNRRLRVNDRPRGGGGWDAWRTLVVALHALCLYCGITRICNYIRIT